MTSEERLDADLDAWAGEDPLRRATATALGGIADAGIALSRLVAEGAHRSGHGVKVDANPGGDGQTRLDVMAHDILLAALRRPGIAALGSEEAAEADRLDPDGLVAVAVDPLDGSSNIDCNLSIGTLFSVLPVRRDGGDPLLQPGRAQVAAGYIVYGPHTDLVLTLGERVDVYTLDPQRGVFVVARRGARIGPETGELAINASNRRHWDEGVRHWYDVCLAGTDGPRGRNFNMRWLASLVAEAHRILARGGVFLYPGDARPGYRDGRLRLVYEANPIALLVEAAGGRASTGRGRVLDLVPTDLHQRTALIFGASEEVGRIERAIADPDTADDSPLFAYRGLFRRR